MSTLKPHPDIKKIPEDFRKRWADALRSSNQHRGGMSNEDDTAHCCLCVAAKLEGAKPSNYEGNNFPHESVESNPISANIEYLSIATSGVISFAPFELNDYMLTHPQIADLLDGKEVKI